MLIRGELHWMSSGEPDDSHSSLMRRQARQGLRSLLLSDRKRAFAIYMISDTFALRNPLFGVRSHHIAPYTYASSSEVD